MIKKILWLLCVMLCAPAQAQLAPPTPVRQTIDLNGVDLFRGTLTAGTPSLSIGDPSSQGLTFSKFWSNGRWSDNLNAMLRFTNGQMIISIGGYSETFSYAGEGNFISTEGTGSTVFENGQTTYWTYYRFDGSIWGFFYGGDDTTPNSVSGRLAYVQLPSGEQRGYSYQQHVICQFTYPCTSGQYIYRVASVSSSFGYLLNFQYQINGIYNPGQEYDWATVTKIKAVNLGEAYCDPAQAPCTPTSGTWPAIEYLSYSQSSDTITEIKDALSRITTYRVNSSGQLVGIKRDGSTSEDVVYGYASGKISSVTTAAGTTTYSYTPGTTTLTTVVTDPLGHVTTNVFNLASQRLTSSTRSTGTVNLQQQWEYDADGRVTKIIQPEGNYTELQYDARGNVTRTRVAPKTGTNYIDSFASFPETCAEPKTCNQPMTTTDGEGHVTNYAYNAKGQVETVTAPSPDGTAPRPKTRYCYEEKEAYYKQIENNLVVIRRSYVPTSLLVGTTTSLTETTCAGTSSDIITVIDYGPQTNGTANNLLPISASTGGGGVTPLRATTAYTYDTIGNMLTVDGSASGTDDTSYLKWDLARQLEGAIGPDPDAGGALKRRAVKYTYDSKGRVTKVEQGTVNDTAWSGYVALQAVDSSYDAIDRKIRDLVRGNVSTTNTTFGVTDYSYDAASNLTCSTLRMNPANWTAATGACTLNTAGPDGPDRIEKRSYDNANRLTLVQSAFGVSGQQRDVATTTWTNNSRMATVTDANGNKTSYIYDGFDRLSETRYPSKTTPGTSSTTDYEGRSYDKNSNVTSIRPRDYSTTNYIYLVYDALNRLTTKNLPGSELDITYTYDILSRLTGASQTGHALSFAYDALNRNTSATSPLGTVSYQYDLAGRRTRVTWPDSYYVSYDYLLTNEMTAMRENGATSGAGVLATFAYDDLGRRTGITRGNGTTASYGYDGVSRLTELKPVSSSALTLGFSYNAGSQITGATRSNDAYAHSFWNRSTSYSVNGLNQYTQAGPSVPTYDGRGNLTAIGTKSYTYSAENHLLTAPGMTLDYDPVARLAKTVTSATTLRKLYDGLDLIGDYDASGTMVRRYVYGPGTDEPMVVYTGSGTSNRAWLHADERGSIIAQSNGSGTITQIQTYDDYGRPGDANTLPFGYTGQVWMQDIGLYYYKARVYDPTLGRFLQTDPIGYGSGMNLYAYVGGDPINMVDPLGLACGLVADQNGITEYDRLGGNCNQSPWRRRGGGYGSIGLGLFRVHADSIQRDYDYDNAIADAIAARQPIINPPQSECHTRACQQETLCAPPISASEAAASRAGDRDGFWNSRLRRRDPVAATALGIFNNSSQMGMVANMRLRDAITTRSPGMSAGAVSAEVQEIGVQLMRAHVNAVNTLGSPSAGRIAAYHHQIFGAHNLPRTTFGGTMITGFEAEANLYAFMWKGC